MKILIVVKPTGDNFIRHYYNSMQNTLLARTANWRYVQKMIQEEKPDLVLYEWGNDLTAECINYINHFGAKIVVRVHDHEVTQGRVSKINWEKVDKVWFISRLIMDMFYENYNFNVPGFFLPNAVDERYFTENIVPKKNKSIALLSIYTRPRKRIDRAIMLMESLPDWTLYIRTDPGGFYEEYNKLRKLSKHLNNVKWQIRSDEFTYSGYNYEDVNEFFQDKCVVLSTSDHEGFHYAIAEGMLCGCKPVVWNWPGADDFWGQYITSTISGMASSIEAYRPSKLYSAYVRTNFSPSVLLPDLYRELDEIL